MYTFYGKTYTGTKGDILHIENICFGILPAYLCMWTLCVPGIYGVLKKFPIWSWSYTWLWPCCECCELKTGLLQEDLTGNKCLDFWNLRILSQQHTSTKARSPNPFSSDSAFNWGSIQTQKLMGLFSFRLPQNLPKVIFQHGNLASGTRAVHSNHPLTLVKQFSVQQKSQSQNTSGIGFPACHLSGDTNTSPFRHRVTLWLTIPCSAKWGMSLLSHLSFTLHLQTLNIILLSGDSCHTSTRKLCPLSLNRLALNCWPSCHHLPRLEAQVYATTPVLN